MKASFASGHTWIGDLVVKLKHPDGTEITASGALYIPVLPAESKETIPLATLQHGTLFDKAQAPSFFKTEGEALSGLIF